MDEEYRPIHFQSGPLNWGECKTACGRNVPARCASTGADYVTCHNCRKTKECKSSLIVGAEVTSND